MNLIVHVSRYRICIESVVESHCIVNIHISSRLVYVDCDHDVYDHFNVSFEWQDLYDQFDISFEWQILGQFNTFLEPLFGPSVQLSFPSRVIPILRKMSLPPRVSIH